MCTIYIISWATLPDLWTLDRRSLDPKKMLIFPQVGHQTVPWKSGNRGRFHVSVFSRDLKLCVGISKPPGVVGSSLISLFPVTLSSAIFNILEAKDLQHNPPFIRMRVFFGVKLRQILTLYSIRPNGKRRFNVHLRSYFVHRVSISFPGCFQKMKQTLILRNRSPGIGPDS